MASARYTLNIAPEDLKPDEPIEYTKKQKAANWWHYNWKIVVAIAVAVSVVGYYAWKALTAVHPDQQIALISAEALPEEVSDALGQALSGLVADANGDGQAMAQIRSYQLDLEGLDASINASSSTDTSTSTSTSAVQDVGGAMNEMTNGYMQMAQSSVLNADLTTGEAVIFLVDEPEAFQRTYGVLSAADGTLVSEDDPMDGVEWFAWSDCPVLTSLDLGEYTTATGETVDCQEYMSRFVVARRGYSNKTPQYLDAGVALFEAITEGATAQ